MTNNQTHTTMILKNKVIKLMNKLKSTPIKRLGRRLKHTHTTTKEPTLEEIKELVVFARDPKGVLRLGMSKVISMGALMVIFTATSTVTSMAELEQAA